MKFEESIIVNGGMSFEGEKTYVQMPDFTQNFNRYSYALNNPLKFTDPSGNKLKWWQGLLIGLGVDALMGGAISSTALLTACAVTTPGFLSATAFAAGVSGFTVAGAAAGVGLGNAVANTTLALIGSTYGGNTGDRVGNAWKLYAGMFKTDKNLNFFGRYWQFMSRYTYEMPVTAFGQAWHGGANAFSPGEVDVGYFHGATVMQTDWMGNGGVTIGSNITIGYDGGCIDANNTTLLHEYGHYLQLRTYGNMAFYNMALSSVTTPKGKHKENWTEQDANYRSARYFQNKITPTQYNDFLTDPYYTGYFNSYSYRLWLGYFMPIEIFTDLFWRK
ncbi:MAG: hypothetical protein LBU84_18035 [Prevotella sp.]|jgi:hypothetical protein|nr:hypothetical protein [Prevotella sp.]